MSEWKTVPVEPDNAMREAGLRAVGRSREKVFIAYFKAAVQAAPPTEPDELARLLKLAKCPDPNCDGKGTVLLGEYQHENGEVEQHLEQCRWCDERDDALRVQAHD